VLRLTVVFSCARCNAGGNEDYNVSSVVSIDFIGVAMGTTGRTSRGQISWRLGTLVLLSLSDGQETCG